jgi:hypothetical protein
MPDLAAQGFFTQDPGVYSYTHLGTAAGTTVIARQPAFLSHIQINQRPASGTIILYDAVSTAIAATTTALIGTIILGTQTFSDPIPFVYKVATKNGLVVNNSANIDLTVAALP